MSASAFARRCTAAFLAVLLAVAVMTGTGVPAALASSITDARQAALDLQQQSSPVTDAVPSAIQQRVEQTAQAYNDAVTAREELEAAVQENQTRIQELNSQLPGLKEQASDALVSSYKYSQGIDMVIDLLFSSRSFDQLLSSIQYFNALNDMNASRIQELVDATQELEARQSDLDAQLEAAVTAENSAAQALAEAQEARAQAQAAAAAAAAAAAQAAAAGSSQTSTSGNAATAGTGSTGTTASSAATDAGSPGTADANTATAGTDEAAGAATEDAGQDPGYVDTEAASSESSITSDRDSFIAEWTWRINAYLDGSPLAGYGGVFAAAAWDYGIDPRFSPAIAFVESSLGAYCFLPYNAWGWGSSSWGSWEEAIYAHVAGLSRGYGPTLDYSDALSYCPPSADYWYYTVQSQMDSI